MDFLQTYFLQISLKSQEFRSLSALTYAYMKWCLFFWEDNTGAFSFPSSLDHNGWVTCKNLHQDFYHKVLQKSPVKTGFPGSFPVYYTKYSILTHGQTLLLRQEERIKVCSSNPAKAVKSSSTFLPLCCLPSPSVTVFPCLLQSQSGKFGYKLLCHYSSIMQFCGMSWIIS